jgi:hypothetical protein
VVNCPAHRGAFFLDYPLMSRLLGGICGWSCSG